MPRRRRAMTAPPTSSPRPCSGTNRTVHGSCARLTLSSAATGASGVLAVATTVIGLFTVPADVTNPVAFGVLAYLSDQALPSTLTGSPITADGCTPGSNARLSSNSMAARANAR